MRFCDPLLLAFLLRIGVQGQEDWIDPTDMRRFSGSLKRELTKSKDTAVGSFKNKFPNEISSEDSSACSHYLTRFLNILLRSTGLQSVVLADEKSMKEVRLEMKVSGRDLKVLQEFSSGTRQMDLHQINEIISEMFIPSGSPLEDTIYNAPSSPSFTSTWSLSSYITPLSVFMFLVCSLIFIFVFHISSGRSHTSAVLTLYIIVFIVAFGWECFRLYNDQVATQKAELMKTETGIPVECTPSKMTVWDSFRNFLRSEDKCEEYFRKVVPHPLSGTDIGLAFSNTFKLMVYSVVAGVGSVINQILGAISDRLFWPLNLILYILLVLLCAAFVVFRSILSFSHFKFSSFFWNFEMCRLPEPFRLANTKPDLPQEPQASIDSANSDARKETRASIRRSGGNGDGVHISMSPEIFNNFLRSISSGGNTSGTQQQEVLPGTSESREVQEAPERLLEKSFGCRLRPGGGLKLRKPFTNNRPPFLRKIGRQTSF